MGMSDEQEFKAVKLFRLPSSAKLRDTFACSRNGIPGTLYVFDTHLCFDAPLFRFQDFIPLKDVKNASIPDELFTLFSIEVDVSDGETYRYSTFFSRKVALRSICEILTKVKGEAESDSLQKSLSEVTAEKAVSSVKRENFIENFSENVKKRLSLSSKLARLSSEMSRWSLSSEVTASPENPVSPKTGVVRAVSVKSKLARLSSELARESSRVASWRSLSSEVSSAPATPVSSKTEVVNAVNAKPGVERAMSVKTDDTKKEVSASMTTSRRKYTPLIVIPLGALALFAVQDKEKRRDVFEWIMEQRRSALVTVAGAVNAPLVKLENWETGKFVYNSCASFIRSMKAYEAREHMGRCLRACGAVVLAYSPRQFLKYLQ